MLAWIAVYQRVRPHLDTGAAGKIFEAVDSFTIDLAHFDAHSRNVSYGIPKSRRVTCQRRLAVSKAR